MVEAHWDGIEAYCHEENQVPLGFVEGFNNKVRTIRRRAYGFREEEYSRLKILTCMLPKLENHSHDFTKSLQEMWEIADTARGTKKNPSQVLTCRGLCKLGI